MTGTSGRANARVAAAVGVAVAVALVFNAPPAAGAGGPPTGKPKKCKKNQVLVKISGKKRCVPINKVFPPPSDVSYELAFAQEALALDLTDVRRPSPAAAKAGRKALLKALPAAVALLDQLRGAAPRSGATRRAPGCAGLPQASAATTSGGTNVSASVGPGGAAFGIDAAVDGVTFRSRYESNVGLCMLEVPRCPTADGTVDARASPKQRVIVEAIKGGQVLARQITTLSRETKVHGEVAEDALLDFIDIHDVAKYEVEATGRPPVRSTIERDLRRFDMRDPTASFNAAASRARVRMSDDIAVIVFHTRDFASYLGDIQSEYHKAERGPIGWANFDKIEPYCPKLVWEPASKTKTLRKLTPWQFSGHVEANSDAGGGTVSKARWEIGEQANGGFSLSGDRGPQVSVDVVVTNAGPQVVATATFKVKSTGGVVREKYEINTEDVPTIRHIAGTFSLIHRTPTVAGDTVFDYSGDVRFDRFTPAIYGGASGSYNLSGEQFAVAASGIDSSGATACHQTGTAQFPIPPNNGSIDVDGTGAMEIEPYTYSFLFFAGPYMMQLTRHNCPSGAESQNGTTFDIPVSLQAQSRPTETSANGISYADSYTETGGGASITTSWNLTGTETPPP